ncbi:hypothetical protein COLO4_31186 [Corchorus olitorius]|uniref:Uncharacterized protein n=1 Tax=Corchorus olitorius TaxID=93759 RepID=A0A1R3H5L0_9ROSI|nr:hypothetical protein COLO4_31186 [Corchorus olitorius]
MVSSKEEAEALCDCRRSSLGREVDFSPGNGPNTLEWRNKVLNNQWSVCVEQTTARPMARVIRISPVCLGPFVGEKSPPLPNDDFRQRLLRPRPPLRLDHEFR